MAADENPLNGVNISTAMHACAKFPAVLQAPGVLPYLTRQLSAIPNNPNEFRARSVSSSIYGLQSVGDSAETRALVAALAPHVEKSQDYLNGQAIGNSIYGLQNIGDSPEVRSLVAALTPKT